MACERQHLVGHVETVGLATRTNPASRQENVDPSAGAEIEHDFSGVKLRDSRRVSTSQRGEPGSVGQRLALLARVELGAEPAGPAGVWGVRSTVAGGLRGTAAARAPCVHRAR